MDGVSSRPDDRRRARARPGSRLGVPQLPSVVGLVDAMIIGAATLLAMTFRDRLGVFDPANDVVENTTVAAAWIIALWLACLLALGAYRRSVFGAGTHEYRLVVNASTATAALVGVAAFLLKFPLSRAFFVMLFLIGVPALLLGRFAMRRVVQRARVHGRMAQRVLLVGSPGHVAEISAVLRRERWLGYHVVGCLLPPAHAEVIETASGVPVLGDTDEVASAVTLTEADIVFFTGGAYESGSELRRVAWDLEDEQHVRIIVAPSVTDVSSERVRIRPVAGLPLVHLERPRSRDASHWAKRAFDVAGSTVLLVLGLPVLLLAAAWIWLTDRGPVLFTQTRIGRDGREFCCYKLRSMVLDAEDRLRDLEEREGHVLFKQSDDPRVTRPGRLIRRFSVDELPQLVNVLRGDMSLVGPRPPLPSEVSRYGDDMRRRLNVRPGLTGLWQVSGRAELSWEDTVRLDLYYVDNWSMVQDLTIMVRTLRAVIAGRGAY
jgi:exopolysaccharide biosynthesis polyprenyl glycosylphosphotransferase